MLDNAMKILVPVDFDADGELKSPSAKALQQALLMARQVPVAITVCHVVDKPPVDDDLTRLQPQSRFKARQKQVHLALEHVLSDANVQGTELACSVETGVPWQVIINLVEQGRHDLVILGTREKNAVGRTLFGKVASRLLRYCPCPVWAVGPEGGVAPSRILVAHDLTETGSLALQQGVRQARLHRARLDVLHVLELQVADQFLGTIGHADLVAQKAAAANAITKECAALGAGSDVNVTVCEGDAHARILDYLGGHDIDLLCMGSVARSGLAGIVTGNTAESVFPWIPCSLLVIKPESFSHVLKSRTGKVASGFGEVRYS